MKKLVMNKRVKNLLKLLKAWGGFMKDDTKNIVVFLGFTLLTMLLLIAVVEDAKALDQSFCSWNGTTQFCTNYHNNNGNVTSDQSIQYNARPDDSFNNSTHSNYNDNYND